MLHQPEYHFHDPALQRIFEDAARNVLTSAAMMDDIVGLVLVQVISSLGGLEDSFSVVTVLRPILVSLAYVSIIF